MKRLELTTEHKKKLFEMSRKLFSDVFDIFEIDDDGSMLLLPNEKEYAQYIHWFEFCLLHLAPKVLDINKYTEPSRTYINSGESQILESYIVHKIHPVDRLYYFFENNKR